MKSLLLCRKVRSENVVAEESAIEGKKRVIYDNKGNAERRQRRRNCPQEFIVARAVLTAHKDSYLI
jgi:hypothetical protein